MSETPQAKESLKPVPKLGMRRFSAVELLIALALLFVSFPFVEEVKGGDVIVSILLSLVLISAVLAVSNRRSWRPRQLRADGSIISDRIWFRRPCFSSRGSSWLLLS